MAMPPRYSYVVVPSGLMIVRRMSWVSSWYGHTCVPSALTYDCRTPLAEYSSVCWSGRTTARVPSSRTNSCEPSGRWKRTEPSCSVSPGPSGIGRGSALINAASSSAATSRAACASASAATPVVASAITAGSAGGTTSLLSADADEDEAADGSSSDDGGEATSSVPIAAAAAMVVASSSTSTAACDFGAARPSARDASACWRAWRFARRSSLRYHARAFSNCSPMNCQSRFATHAAACSARRTDGAMSLAGVGRAKAAGGEKVTLLLRAARDHVGGVGVAGARPASSTSAEGGTRYASGVMSMHASG
mmetsp:Transcript_41339/g.127758  ORF Transcript_41339/g.127758 Transcript_41339/m.127758 type:complete len:307 (-) Transcript_41339:106-1026(-)